MIKAGDSGAALKSETEVKSAIEANDDLLTQALGIGERSLVGKSIAVLTVQTASMVAYLMLKWGWQAQRIHEKLALFQTGTSMVSNDEPFYVASTYIGAKRKRAARGEKLTTTSELAVVIYAMVEAERGVKAIQAKHIKAAAEGRARAPCATYPDLDEPQAAAE